MVKNTEKLYASNKELQSPHDGEEREAGLEPPILQEEIAMKQLSNHKGPMCINFIPAENMGKGILTGLEMISVHSITKKGDSRIDSITKQLSACLVLARFKIMQQCSIIQKKITRCSASFIRGCSTHDLITNLCWIIQKFQ